MLRYAKIIGWTLVALFVALVLCVVILFNVNGNYLKPQVNQYASQMAHRSIEVHGNLSLQWIKPADVQSGWRRWVRWPEVTAEHITVGNPPWGKSGSSMAEIGRLVVSLNPLALLDHVIQLPTLDIHEANVLLERNAQQQNNWTFTQDRSTAPSDWQVDLGQLRLQQVNVQVVDAVNTLKFKSDLNSLDSASPEGYGIGWKASGSYNDVQLNAQGRAGDVLSLRRSDHPFPFQGDVTVGETRIEVQGSVTKPQALAALDVQLKLAGETMSDLLALIGVALPNTPPYSTQGRLIAQLDGQVDTWRYENFKGKVGSSDIEGTLEYLRKQPRPLLQGEVQSKLLRFADLGPLIGVDSRVNKKKAVRQPAGKALPVAPIATSTWGVMDADVKFKGQKILRDKDLPLEDISAHIKLVDRVLALTPLDFGVAGGNLRSNITLNGQGETIKAKMEMSARHLKLKKLFPGAESMKASFGELHGTATLTSEGNSIAALLGKSNGEVQALVSKGTISHFLLEAAGLNIANLVILKLFGDEQVVLNCMASDFSVKNGLMQVRAFQLDTEDAIIDVSGQINLATETLALDIKPANKTLRIFTLRSPLYVKGTFKNPDVGVYTGALAARAGGAIALGLIATPFAALLPLLNMGTNQTNECGALLKKANDKPQAPSTPNVESKTREPNNNSNRLKGSVPGREAVTN